MPSGVKNTFSFRFFSKNCCSSLNSSHLKLATAAPTRRKKNFYLSTAKNFLRFCWWCWCWRREEDFFLKNESESGFSSASYSIIQNLTHEEQQQQHLRFSSTHHPLSRSFLFYLLSVGWGCCWAKNERKLFTSNDKKIHSFTHSQNGTRTTDTSSALNAVWGGIFSSSLSKPSTDPPWLSFFLLCYFFFLFFKTETTFPIIFFHLFSVNCWAL